MIKTKMEQTGIISMSAYLRKMAIDGYVIKLELPELREMISLLRRSSNNLNQIAKHINTTGRIYAEDIDEILRWQEKLWQCANEILKQLAAIA
ncbi:plasmid mobilization relaxosome protein MobC [Pseudoflavonifractor sp. 524-17]|nr:plasmid mobilization relaxosome protein MobC [Pseudoflavonifractor sp. 524-17]